MTKTLSLYELNSIVASVIDIDMSGDYWVVAEISELREVRGHCYMELVEKDELSNTPIAKASAKCWASRWSMLRPMFERITGQRLHAGMKVMQYGRMRSKIEETMEEIRRLKLICEKYEQYAEKSDEEKVCSYQIDRLEIMNHEAKNHGRKGLQKSGGGYYPDRRQRQYRICNTLCNQIASDRQR